MNTPTARARWDHFRRMGQVEMAHSLMHALISHPASTARVTTLAEQIKPLLEELATEMREDYPK